MNITVVLIHHRNGEDVRIALDRKEVTRQLAEYCREKKSKGNLCALG